MFGYRVAVVSSPILSHSQNEDIETQDEFALCKCKKKCTIGKLVSLVWFRVRVVTRLLNRYFV